MTIRTRTFLFQAAFILAALAAAFALTLIPNPVAQKVSASCEWQRVGGFSTSFMEWGYGMCGDPDCYVASPIYDGTCMVQESNYSCGIYSSVCTADVCPVGQVGVYPDCHAPTCSDDPMLDGCPCSKANACNTTSGSYSGGSCNAAEPAACPTCTPDYSCAANTCPLDTCTATNADCSTTVVGGANWGACPPFCVPTTGEACTSGTNSCGMTNSGTVQCNGSCSATTPSDALCGAVCTPDTSCAASTCNTETCTATAADCSTYSIPGTNPGACSAGATPSVSCTPSSQNLPSSGGTANFNAVPADGAGATYTWIDGSNNVLGTSSGSNTTFSHSFANDAAVRVRASDGTGGYVYSGYCVVDVAAVSGGACPATDVLTITASPNRVRADMSTPIDLNWSGTGIDSASCTVTNVNTGVQVGNSTVTTCNMSGSATIATGVSAQTVYRLTCGAYTKDAIVNIVPSFEEF